MNTALFYTGSAVLFLWGAAHLLPVKNIVKGFGKLSDDNRHIITMEWMAEGFALCFIGALAAASVMFGNTADATFGVVMKASIVMLFVMATLSFFTGFKTSIIPIKICPFVKIFVAGLYIAGLVL